MDLMSVGAVYACTLTTVIYIGLCVCACVFARVHVWLGFLLNFVKTASAIVFASLSPDTYHHLACLIPLASVCCVRVQYELKMGTMCAIERVE